jgi:tetratricopeptide (TPR) repeat protein
MTHLTNRRCRAIVLLVALLAPPLWAQSKITIAAGTPEDQDLQAISNQADEQKRTAMLEEFVRKFAANPAAVAYGNWQLAQQYVAAGDPQKALAYGDQALAAMPDVVDILVSQIDLAQRLKDSSKVVDYAVRGAAVIHGIGKTPKPAELTPEDFANQLAIQKEALQPSFHYMEVAGYNAITSEQNAPKRMPEIDRYLAAFPESQFAEPLATLGVVTLQAMKDSAGLAAFGDKVLAQNPNDIRLLTVLASAYSGDPQHLAKAGAYARRAVELQKTQPAATPTDRKLAGVAHSVLGRVLLQESKFAAAATELKAATTLLHDSPEDLAGACYYLGFAYVKMERAADAISALKQAADIPGPYQQPARDLLTKIYAARTKR